MLDRVESLATLDDLASPDGVCKPKGGLSMNGTLCAVGLAGACLARTAVAGIADSPVPLLMGQKAQVLYSVPGIINAGSLGTYVSCTSTAKTPSIVAVEVFQNSGGAALNDASATFRANAAGTFSLPPCHVPSGPKML